MKIDKNEAKTTNISGKYIHYKGKPYDLYCICYDKYGNKYILYRQKYGDDSFWIRPYDMFFDTLDHEGQKVRRFEATKSPREAASVKITKLISILNDKNIDIKHSESQFVYHIVNIDAKKDSVTIHSNQHDCSSGYLTEHELINRLGYHSCMLDGEIKFYKKKHADDNMQLSIGSKTIDELKYNLNPCSIDLEIADSGFLCTKQRTVDPQSVEHISRASDLWKNMKIHRSKNTSKKYIKLKPGATVLTHTKERIKIPNDCAGKIEIKSTFARLSLDITSGDFCNPGYDGYFPLEITNHGKHTIILHESEMMAQLMLIPLHGAILIDYHEKASHKNNKGFDDGTPYTFWRERSIKSLREKHGTQELINIYYKLSSRINTKNTEDINSFRQRFDNNFLAFCQKKVQNQRYQDKDKGIPDAKKIIYAYIRREKNMKIFFKAKWTSVIFSILLAVCPVLLELFLENKIEVKSVMPYFIMAAILLVTAIILFVKSPKCFCTFDGIDISNVIDPKPIRKSNRTD